MGVSLNSLVEAESQRDLQPRTLRMTLPTVLVLPVPAPDDLDGPYLERHKSPAHVIAGQRRRGLSPVPLADAPGCRWLSASRCGLQ